MQDICHRFFQFLIDRLLQISQILPVALHFPAHGGSITQILWIIKLFFKKVLTSVFFSAIIGALQKRGISAVGSAQHWQCWGQGFESPMLHQTKPHPNRMRFCFIQVADLVYHQTLVCISSPKVYIITRQRASVCDLMIYKVTPWWYTKLCFDDIHATGVIGYNSSTFVGGNGRPPFAHI